MFVSHYATGIQIAKRVGWRPARVLYDLPRVHSEGIAAIVYDATRARMVVVYDPGLHPESLGWTQLLLPLPSYGEEPVVMLRWGVNSHQEIVPVTYSDTSIRPGHELVCAHVVVDVVPADEVTRRQHSFSCTKWRDGDRVLLPRLIIQR